MPLYDYRCNACGKVTEVRHGFDESFSGACPACGGTLQRLFNPAPIVFKGSGFYVTDSRKKSADVKKSDGAKTEPAKSDAPASETKTEAKSESKTEAKAESKPAEGKSGSDSAA